MTQKEARKEWIRRLRSGKIKQTKGVLGRPDGSRCCLGVACDIAVEAGIIPPPKTDTAHTTPRLSYMGDIMQVLPVAVRNFLGLQTCDGAWCGIGFKSLAFKNDKGKTFEEIANIIESNPPELFV